MWCRSGARPAVLASAASARPLSHGLSISVSLANTQDTGPRPPALPSPSTVRASSVVTESTERTAPPTEHDLTPTTTHARSGLAPPSHTPRHGPSAAGVPQDKVVHRGAFDANRPLVTQHKPSRHHPALLSRSPAGAKGDSKPFSPQPKSSDQTTPTARTVGRLLRPLHARHAVGLSLPKVTTSTLATSASQAAEIALPMKTTLGASWSHPRHPQSGYHTAARSTHHRGGRRSPDRLAP